MATLVEHARTTSENASAATSAMLDSSGGASGRRRADRRRTDGSRDDLAGALLRLVVIALVPVGSTPAVGGWSVGCTKDRDARCDRRPDPVGPMPGRTAITPVVDVRP